MADLTAEKTKAEVNAEGSTPSGAPAKKRRRRRRGKGSAPQERDDKPAQPSAPNGNKKRSRRRRPSAKDGNAPPGNRPSRLAKDGKKGSTEVSALRLVEGVSSPPSTQQPVDVPLSSSELADFKRYFLLLRDYKKQLKLKLNAQEDLLVNGAREPSSRGVCQHLLSKVDYSLVASAASRMDAADRPRMLGGILEFKRELAFLLLYLEALKEAGDRQATTALEHALEQIDFSVVTEGQMRRVLELIVELFDTAGRAALMLGLLQSESFRAAFDQSLSKLPAELGEVVTPIRAVHAVVFKGNDNSFEPAALGRGIELLLSGAVGSLIKKPLGVRRRLLRAAFAHAPQVIERQGSAIRALLTSFEPESKERRALEFEWIELLLKNGQDARAEKRLHAFSELYPDDQRAKQLLTAVRAPKLDRVALLRGGLDAPLAHLNPALSLDGQAPLWLRSGSSADLDELKKNLELQTQLTLPATARVVLARLEGERPFVALRRQGELLTPNHALFRSRTSAQTLVQQRIALAAGLAACGFTLPDLATRRFEVDAHGHLRLVNLWKLERPGVDEATRLLLPLAAELRSRESKDSEPEKPCTSFAELLDWVETDCAQRSAWA